MLSQLISRTYIIKASKYSMHESALDYPRLEEDEMNDASCFTKHSAVSKVSAKAPPILVLSFRTDCKLLKDRISK